MTVPIKLLKYEDSCHKFVKQEDYRVPTTERSTQSAVSVGRSVIKIKQ